MTRSRLIAVTLVALLLATTANAGPKANKGNGNGHSSALDCPPGLAKKNPPCVPPGQAGHDKTTDNHSESGTQDDQDYAVGSHLPDPYVIMFDPLLYPYWPQAVYARSGDFLYLIDPATGEILNLAGPVTDWDWHWSGVDFAHCPPGLAKKNPPCVPPGQAKKGVTFENDPYHIGERLPDGYQVILTPARQTANDDALYVRLGDSLYRMDRKTGLVLQLIGTIASLLR